MSYVTRIKVLGLCLLLLVSRQGLHAQRSTGIVGRVMLPTGQLPDHPVRLTLESHGAAIATTVTDSAGKFAISGIERGIYRILVNDDQFRPIDEEIAVDAEIADPTVVRLTLLPKGGPSTAGPDAGKNPNLVGAAEFKQFPKSAVKEYEKGVRASKDGRMEEAIDHYQLAIKLASDLYLARNNLGSIYLGQSQFGLAQEQFEQVIKINPADGAAYFNLGNLFLMTQKYEDASLWIDQGLAKEPNNAMGHFLRGSVYAQTGNIESAEKEFHISLQLDPKTAKPHLALVNIFLQQGRQADAANELRQYLRDFPDDSYSLKAQEVLQRLENQTGKTQNR